jgi:transposase-like protein
VVTEADRHCCIPGDASKQRDCRYETPPPSPSSSSAICLRRFPLPTRGHRHRGSLLRFTPLLADAARPCRHAVGDRWNVDETYVKVAGHWRYVYRAIDQFGQVIDVFVSPRRDARAARWFFQQAIGATKVTPVEVTTDQAPVYPGVLEALLPAAWHRTDQYANNGIECDHGRLKARLRPMRGLKQDRSAQVIIAGYALVQNLRRGHTSWQSTSWRPGGWPPRPMSSPWRSDPGSRSGLQHAAG